MICKNCGKEIPEGYRFCDSCGAKVEPVVEQKPVNEPVNTYADTNGFTGEKTIYSPSNGANANNAYATNPAPLYAVPKNEEQVVSAWGYIWRNIVMGLLMAIPVLGFIINIVLLCVWMGDRTKQASFRNWAKASLIMWIIGIVAGVIISVLLTMGLLALGHTYGDLVNEFRYY